MLSNVSEISQPYQPNRDKAEYVSFFYEATVHFTVEEEKE